MLPTPLEAGLCPAKDTQGSGRLQWSPPQQLTLSPLHRTAEQMQIHQALVLGLGASSVRRYEWRQDRCHGLANGSGQALGPSCRSNHFSNARVY